MIFVLQHPTRGVLAEMDGSTPRFSWAIPRDEGVLFPSLSAAEKARGRIAGPLQVEVVIFGGRENRASRRWKWERVG